MSLQSRTVLEPSTWLDRRAIAVVNPQGRAPFVFVCDHASNWMPPSLRDLGLPVAEVERHIAWDPGALEVAQRLSARLDAPLVHATVSRLVLDVNRDPEHPGSIVTLSEDTPIPGNRDLSPPDRARRIREIYEPYHHRLAAVIERQVSQSGAPPSIIAIHSFTPVYRGECRPWHIGVLSDTDRRLAQPLLALLRSDGELTVGDNQPYAATDGVYHTLATHCALRNLRSVMIELRSDLIGDAPSQDRWAEKLANALQAIH
jgi:predicted N-formylglutamate amidohydrolase